MEKIKEWLAAPEFKSGVNLLEDHTHYRNMVRIMRNSGETPEHMETLMYELGKLVPAEETIQPELTILFNGQSPQAISDEFRKKFEDLDENVPFTLLDHDGKQLYKGTKGDIRSLKDTTIVFVNGATMSGLGGTAAGLSTDLIIYPNNEPDASLEETEEGKKRVALVLEKAAMLSQTLFLPTTPQ